MKSNMNIMKIFYLFLIECIIIMGISLPFAETKKTDHQMVNASQIKETLEVEAETFDPCPLCNYAGYIILIAAMVTMAVPGAAGWYLYHRLKKRVSMTDEEKAMEDSQPETLHSTFKLLSEKLTKKKTTDGKEKAPEDSQPETFTAKMHLWLSKNCSVENFSLFYNAVRTIQNKNFSLSINCTGEKFKRLFDRLRKKKPINDEEKAIEQSQPESKPSISTTTARDTPDTGKETAVTKKHSKTIKKVIKKKKVPASKPVEESLKTPSVQPEQIPQTPAHPKKIKIIMRKKKVPASEPVEESLITPAVKQYIDEPVQPEQIPQTPAHPKKIKIIMRKKKVPASEPVEESPPVKQYIDEPVQPEQIPQTPAHPKKIKVIKRKKKVPVSEPVEESPPVYIDEQIPQTPVLPEENVCFMDESESEQQEMVPLPESALSAESEYVQTETVYMSPLVESQKETPCNVRYKRKIVLTWMEAITDDEDNG